MAETAGSSDQQLPRSLDLRFGEEIEIESAGFSFKPVLGFELEIDGSVYQYADDGNLEIRLMGGELQGNGSIAELSHGLTARFLKKVEHYQWTEAGTDTIQGVSGFLSEINFIQTEDESRGKAFICAPYPNQFFFILVSASASDWQTLGEPLFTALKTQIHFHPQFEPPPAETEIDPNPDLTLEIFEQLEPDDDFVLTMEKGDVSLLLAARAFAPDDVVTLTEVLAPGGKPLYAYQPLENTFSSTVWKQPLISGDGEVCLFFPRTNQQSLFPGEYRFSFDTQSGRGLQEVQVIIRTERALDLQSIDLNFWVALENGSLDDPDTLDQFKSSIEQELTALLAPLNLAPGKIEFFFPAPDELSTFSSINLQSDLADCSYMISETVTQQRALNIGLVDEITSGSESEKGQVNAISCGAPGMILSSPSPHACILIAWHAFAEDHRRLAEEIIRQLIVFSGIEWQDTAQPENDFLILNHEIGWRLRRHPLFHAAH